MNPLLLALLGGMYGSSPNSGLGSSPLLQLLLHGLVGGGLGNTAAGPSNNTAQTPPTAPPSQRPTSSTPALQGYQGATSAKSNPNQGGYSGLNLSEMTHPGLATGLFGPQTAVLGLLSRFL